MDTSVPIVVALAALLLASCTSERAPAEAVPVWRERIEGDLIVYRTSAAPTLAVQCVLGGGRVAGVYVANDFEGPFRADDLPLSPFAVQTEGDYVRVIVPVRLDYRKSRVVADQDELQRLGALLLHAEAVWFKYQGDSVFDGDWALEGVPPAGASDNCGI